MNSSFSDQQRFQTERDGEAEKKVRTYVESYCVKLMADNWVKVANERVQIRR